MTVLESDCYDLGVRNNPKKRACTPVKGVLRECDMKAWRREISTAGYARSFEALISFNGRRRKATVDGGVVGNFISKILVDGFGLPAQKKQGPYELAAIDRSLLSKNEGQVEMKTHALPMGFNSTIRRSPLILWKWSITTWF